MCPGKAVSVCLCSSGSGLRMVGKKHCSGSEVGYSHVEVEVAILQKVFWSIYLKEELLDKVCFSI